MRTDIAKNAEASGARIQPIRLLPEVASCLSDWEDQSDMPKYVYPIYPRSDVNKAGRILANPPLLGAHQTEWALDVINNWRASHGYPLNAIAMNLRNRARKRDRYAILAQRLKRIRSIEAKLRRFQTMRLLQVQDIGGCRAVLRDVFDVRDLVKDYDLSDAKNPHRHRRVGFDDYISNPKIDGYRSVHLIYEYRGSTPQTHVFDGQKIEIQIRSQLQHAWATAVETVDTFTGQALKSSAGTREWQRFFALMSSALARREHTALVPGTPADERELLEALRQITFRLDVRTKLEGWRAAISYIQQGESPDAKVYLLILDSRARRLRITGFRSHELAQASDRYREAERDPDANAVLVTVDSLAALPIAYPNYYLDTDVFLNALQFAIDQAHLA